MHAHREFARPPPTGTSGAGAVSRFAAATFDVSLLGRELRFFAHVTPTDRHTAAADGGLSHAALCAEAARRFGRRPAAVLRLTNGVRDVEPVPRDAPPVHTVITLPQRYSRADADPAPPPPADPLSFAAFGAEVRRVAMRAKRGESVLLSVHCHHGCNRTGQMLAWLAMRAGDEFHPTALAAALSRFGAARAACGPGTVMGVYDEDVLWALYLFWFACPPPRALRERRAAPPWRQPLRPSAAPDEWAEAAEFSAVPRPSRASGSAAGGGRARDVARDNPLEVRARISTLYVVCGPRQFEKEPTAAQALGCRTEWAELMIMNSGVRGSLLRAAGHHGGVAYGFNGCMPRELVDADVLRLGYLVSVKADGTRAQLVFDRWGAALILRSTQVVAVNVMRPAEVRPIQSPS